MSSSTDPGESHPSLIKDGTTSSSASEVDSDPFREPSCEIDGHDEDPIAICGFSIKFPDDATSPEGLWKMLIEKHCASREFPSNRFNAKGFHQHASRLNTNSVRGGHFIEEDLGLFDADFFSISPSEAASLDPQQRLLLEVAYTALENAGISMESVSGSSTAVYTGCFGVDHILQLARDSENAPPYAAIGLGISMLANRLSWFFNLRGPSIGVDSACSSTAMALDIACKALQADSCSMAMVAGCNTASGPEAYNWMSNINFLSPDGRCFSFDSRANGYARGEGIGVMILKKLSHAIRDGNTIRAVVRATGCNEDGKTPSITQPSREAQEVLINETYRKAGLSMEHTRFFEAHGTGTAIGDPREAQAIGCSFRKYRSAINPLYVGALKSNIGHLEGASGLAGLIKAVLALEKGVIPPNANFQKVNPKIDTEFLGIRFPSEATPWPTFGLRRASINAFGYGGANAHVVLDDAYNYMRQRSLNGRHCTATVPPRTCLPIPLLESKPREQETIPSLRLLVWSAADSGGITRIAKSLQEWDISNLSTDDFIGDLAYTLGSHRSRLGWRSFALAQGPEDLRALSDKISEPARKKSSTPRIGYVFSGQGAQWPCMGRELLCYSSFEAELEEAGSFLAGLGCPWQPKEELLKSEYDSNVDKADYSQALCTILQVALVNLLRRFDIHPSALVGHSSGEIAAAFAMGAISQQSAWKIAYYRGACAAKLSETEGNGGMMSVGLSESQVQERIDPINKGATSFGLTVACINSPSSVTVSGENHLIDNLKKDLGDKVFSRRLRVPVAYHSGQMKRISDEYVSLIGNLPESDEPPRPVPMISSVTGELISPETLKKPAYWALNLVSPVRFSHATSAMVANGSLVKKLDRSHASTSVVDHLLELGPHSALQAPIRDILAASKRGSYVSYSSVLKRKTAATDTLLSVVGELWCMGLSPNLRAVNEPQGERSRSMLTNVPAYPFDHSRRYGHETRLGHNYKFRKHAPSELLGVISPDSTISEARWRHFIRLSESPWAEHHKVNGTIMYPASGMIVMAIEAVKQLFNPGEISSFVLSDVRFGSPMKLFAHGNGLEVQTSLSALESSNRAGSTFKFVIRCFTENNRDGIINARGIISVNIPISPETQQWEDYKTRERRQSMEQDAFSKVAECESPVDSVKMYKFLNETGYQYGTTFQALQKQRCNESRKCAAAEVPIFSSSSEPHTIHPVTLDALLHLSFTALTSGGKDAMATALVTGIDRLWLSNKGLSAPDDDFISAWVSVSKRTTRSQHYNGGALGSSSGKDLRLWYENFETTSVTSVPERVPGPLGFLTPPSRPDPKQFCMTIDTKPALDKLSVDDTYSQLRRMGQSELDSSQMQLDLEVLCIGAIVEMMDTVDQAVLQNREPWVRRYWTWAEHHLAKHRQAWDDPQSAIGKARWSEPWEHLCERLRSTSDLGLGFVTVAQNLPELIKGETTPLELLMVPGILDKLYRAVGTISRIPSQAAAYVDLLAHQKPGLKILEVGGGTASATRQMIKALAAKPLGSGTLRCSQYTFTDISPSFLESARKEFTDYRSQMVFGTLDLDKDILEQGYEEGAYDLVIADNVIHATLDLPSTLRNIRKVLRPGGQLMMNEVLNPDGWTAGFVFGLFSGWWAGADQGRELSPLVDEEGWDSVLRGADYNGADLVLCEIPHDQPTRDAYVIASASPRGMEEPVVRNSDSCTIVINSTSTEQQKLCSALLSSLGNDFGREPQVLNFDDVSVEKILAQNLDQVVISLLDYGSSFLSSLNETAWTRLKTLVRSSQRMLWISDGGGKNPAPENGMMDGLARTLRLERYDLQLITIGLESLASLEAKSVQHVVQLALELACLAPGMSYEQEYVEIDGLLHTRRLTEANQAQSAIHDNLVKAVDVPLPVGQAEFEMSTTSTAGHESGVFYTESRAPVEEDLGPGDVDVSVKAASLQTLGRDAPPGYDRGPLFSNHCAGVVLRAGSDAGFQQGDRVLVTKADACRSHVRTSSESAVALPADVSFEDACAAAPPIAMAHHALLQVARARPGDTVLIQDGASPIGQASIRLLDQVGVKDVWLTVSGEDERAWAAQNSGLPDDRILPISLADGLISSVQWRQRFDIVLSPYASHVDLLAMSCVRPGGRYIMLRSGRSEDSLELQGMPSSVSLSVIQHGSEIPFDGSLRYMYAVEALKKWKRNDNDPYATHYSAPELTTAFSRIQNLSIKDVVVLTFHASDIIKVSTPKKPTYTLRPDVSYLISGLGGVGRELARWLVRRGARSLILLSRSGTKRVETRALITELQAQDVHVECPACDITERTSVRSVLDDCLKRMPPVAGCIQGAMHMTSSVFDTMSFDQWKSNISPKTRGTWNLHLELPKGLDFFICASSIMGIVGAGGLAAYNAGNTYQDALMRYRVSQGEHAVAINIGPIPDAGYVSKSLEDGTGHIVQAMLSKMYALTYVRDVCAVLDHCCDPAGSLFRTAADCQISFGLRPVSHWRHLLEPPHTTRQPFWGHMHHIPALEGGDREGGTSSLDEKGVEAADDSINGVKVDIGPDSAGSGQATEVAKKLAARVAIVLGTTTENIDIEDPMDSYGLDSLSAIHLRNWIGTSLHVDVQVFELLGGITFTEAGAAICRKIEGEEI